MEKKVKKPVKVKKVEQKEIKLSLSEKLTEIAEFIDKTVKEE